MVDCMAEQLLPQGQFFGEGYTPEVPGDGGFADTVHIAGGQDRGGEGSVFTGRNSMFLSVGDHQDVPLHGGDADLGGLRFQESVIVKADCIGQELILIRREQIFTAIKSPDKGSAGDLLLQLVEVFGLGDSVCWR